MIWAVDPVKLPFGKTQKHIIFQFKLRMDRKIVRKSKENPKLAAPEIREVVSANDISKTLTVQRRLNEAGLYGRKLQKSHS